MDTRDLGLDELKCLLLSRGYNSGVVSEALGKAIQVSREEALRKVEKRNTQRLDLVFNMIQD